MPLQVVLKIIKHCREGLPTFVAGSLLGLDVDEALEVTNCFPFPSTSEEQGDGMAGEDYHMAMLKSLEDVSVTPPPHTQHPLQAHPFSLGCAHYYHHVTDECGQQPSGMVPVNLLGHSLHHRLGEQTV